jgi:hypothetical protein
MFATEGDSRHPDEVVGAGEERSEGGREGDISADGHAHGGRDELLLGDEHLEVALGMRLGEVLRVGGVVHLPVQGDHVAAGANGSQRRTEGPPGGDLGARLVTRQAHLAAGPDPGGPAFRLRPVDDEVALAAQLGDGPLSHLRGQRPAVPALTVLDLGEPAALAGAGQDHGGLARLAHGGERLVDFVEVVPFDGNGTTAEPLNPLGIKSRSQPSSVGPRWPRRFTSTMAVKLASR